MRMKKLVWAFITLYIPLVVQAQEKKDSVLRFSLNEAKAYALTNSPVIKNSALDLETAKKKIWETTSIGLPQVNGKLSYSYTLEQSSLINSFSGLTKSGSLPYYLALANIRIDSLVDKNSYNQKAVDNINKKIDEINNVKSGDYKNSLGADITISQLIFSGGYIVGLQTSKTYKALSELAITKSENDIAESVTNSYFLVLIAYENKQILESTYKNTEKISNEINEQFKAGFIDENTADQMKITLSNLKASLDMISRQFEITKNLLKFQLGIDMSANVELTDSISGLVANTDYSLLLSTSYAVESSVDYKLLQTQEKLQELNLKYTKSNYLPTISGYYQFHKQLNKDYPDFQAPQSIGISASMPIFTSGQNYSKVGQARIALEKQRNTNWQATQGLKIDYERSKSDYLTALDKYNTEKQNLELSNRIYNRSLIQFKQGTISGLDLTQTQNQFLQTQSNYFTAISQLSSAKAKFEKLINSIK